MKIIAEVASPEYYEEQAILLIRQAQDLRYSEEYQEKMIEAERLLLLARHYGQQKD